MGDFRIEEVSSIMFYKNYKYYLFAFNSKASRYKSLVNLSFLVNGI